MGEAREWVLTAVVGVAMLWKLLCVWLRSRRNKLLLSFSPIEDAVTVRTLMANVEFPFVCHLSLEFALFRTYAIPSISSILAKSGKFDSDAVKRADDTEILIREFQSHHVDSDRGSAALRRLNYIHSQYPIKNGDYLYVLGLFILEPIRWIHQYGFRDMTTAEKLANFVSWRDIGIRMGIKDIPEDLEALEKWQEEYEVKHKVYADTNRKIADITVGLLLQTVPKFTLPVFRPLIFAMPDDRLREAFGYPKQPQWLQIFARTTLKFFAGTCIGLLHIPRPLALAVDRIPVDTSEQGDQFDLNKVRKLAFDRYGSRYPGGYKIGEVGNGKPGVLGSAFPGELLCPLSDRYFQTSWPPRSNGR